MMGRLPRACANGVLVLLLAAGCTSSTERPRGSAAVEDDPSPPPEALQRAEQAADALGAELMETLTEELIDGGPVQALRVCSEVAQAIATAHSHDGVLVRRVSRKVRNPADTPDAYEREVLVQFAARLEGGQPLEASVEVVEHDGQRTLRYLRPIRIMEPCLTCHGGREQMDPELLSVLDERYPNDAATGYRDGDLRGAISVSVALDGG